MIGPSAAQRQRFGLTCLCLLLQTTPQGLWALEAGGVPCMHLCCGFPPRHPCSLVIMYNNDALPPTLLVPHLRHKHHHMLELQLALQGVAR